MKKIFLVALLTITGLQVTAQKTKKPVTPKNEVLATVDNVSAEIIVQNKVRKLVLFVKNETKTDTLLVKQLPDANYKPNNFSLKSFTTSDTKLYHVSWQEMILVDTKIKKETTSITENQVWNTTTGKQLFNNFHKSYYLKETQFLDKNKTASHDVEKKSSEGSEFHLLPNGDISLFSKSQQSHYVYNVANDKYEVKKAQATPKASPKPKPKRR